MSPPVNVHLAGSRREVPTKDRMVRSFSTASWVPSTRIDGRFARVICAAEGTAGQHVRHEVRSHNGVPTRFLERAWQSPPQAQGVRAPTMGPLCPPRHVLLRSALFNHTGLRHCPVRLQWRVQFEHSKKG